MSQFSKQQQQQQQQNTNDIDAFMVPFLQEMLLITLETAFQCVELPRMVELFERFANFGILRRTLNLFEIYNSFVGGSMILD